MFFDHCAYCTINFMYPLFKKLSGNVAARKIQIILDYFGKKYYNKWV